jgi:hypothetical protein
MNPSEAVYRSEGFVIREQDGERCHRPMVRIPPTGSPGACPHDGSPGGRSAYSHREHVPAELLMGVAMASSAELPDRDLIADDVFEFAYEDLKRIARRHLCSSESHVTLSTTELVHESYLKLQASPRFNDNAHFFGSAARTIERGWLKARIFLLKALET